jgi:uncharacterized repeat protein (TIGR02543 family)
MKLLKSLLLLVLSVALAGVFASCGDAGAASYTVTYILSGGVNNPDNPASYTAESETITLQAPSRDGYTFTGWAPEGVIPAGSTGDKTFTANWTKNDNDPGNDPGGVTVKYTLTVKSEDTAKGTAAGGGNYAASESVTVTAAPAGGYIFAGWYDGTDRIENAGESYTFTMPERAATLEARFEVSVFKFEELPDGTYSVSAANTSISRDVVIPATYNGKSVTEIKDSAFYNCSALWSVGIPASVTRIGRYAFWHCLWIKSIDIPGSVKIIDDNAFMQCTQLASVTIGDGVESIADSAFYGCDDLQSVVIPDSVQSIGSQAFGACENLVSVTIGSGVESIGSQAFEQTKLASVIIPSNVTTMGWLVFYQLKSGRITINVVRDSASEGWAEKWNCNSVGLTEEYTDYHTVVYSYDGAE